MIPEDHPDIFVTPPKHAAVQKKRTERITGARYLRCGEYAERLSEKDRKKKEAEKLQQKRKAQRDQKKKEREEKKKVMEEKRRQREAKKSKKALGRKCTKNYRPNTRHRLCLESSDNDDEVPQECSALEGSPVESYSNAISESDKEPETSLVGGPHAILPARFRDNRDGNDVVCDIGHMAEPVNMASETVLG